MAGAAVFVGSSAATIWLSLEVAVVVSAALLALITTRSVLSTSAPTSWYVAAVAPAMSAQLAPCESQRCHWLAYVIGVVPAHVPLSAASVSPSRAMPEIVGAAVLAGATADTAPVAVEVAVVD